MKRKIDARIILFGILVTVSLSAYGYLNHPSRFSDALPNVLDTVTPYERYEQAPDNDPLPDIQILEKLLDLGKRLIPAH